MLKLTDYCGFKLYTLSTYNDISQNYIFIKRDLNGLNIYLTNNY